MCRKAKAGYCPPHGQHVSTPATLPDQHIGVWGEKRIKAARVSHLNASCCLLFGYPSPATSPDAPHNELPSLTAVFREVGHRVHGRAKLLKAMLRPIENIRLLKGNLFPVLTLAFLFLFVWKRGRKVFGKKPVNGDRRPRGCLQNVRILSTVLK